MAGCAWQAGAAELFEPLRGPELRDRAAQVRARLRHRHAEAVFIEENFAMHGAHINR